MAKLISVFLAIWLVAAVLSIQLAIADNCLSFLEVFKLKKILKREPEKRTSVEWKKLVCGANKALSNAKYMDIERALEIFQHVDGEHGAKLDRREADILINLRNISEDKCEQEKSPISKEFGKLLLRVIENKSKFPELYKAVKVSLNYYTRFCGLEDRYNKIVQRSVSETAVDQSTLADQLLGESHGSLEEGVRIFGGSLLWALSLINDPRFGLINEIKCEEDEQFIEKIATGLKTTYSRSLTKYANDVFANYFKACGYEDRFKLVVEKVFPEYEKHTTLADYLKHYDLRYYQKKKLFPLVRLVLDLTSLNTSDKQNCDGFTVTNNLVDRLEFVQSYITPYHLLFKYVQVVLEEHLATCGFKNQFKQEVREFMEEEADSWELIESWIGGKVATNELLVDEACRKFWNQTYGGLVDLAVARYDQIHWHMIDHDYELEHWLENLQQCAFKLKKDDEYVVRRLGRLIAIVKITGKRP